MSESILKIKTDSEELLKLKSDFDDEMKKLVDLSTKYFHEGFEFIGLDNSFVPAVGADECRIIFKPTNKLIEFVSALRAFNVNAS